MRFALAAAIVVVGLVSLGGRARASVVVVSPTHWTLARLGGVAEHPEDTYDLSGAACPSRTFCLLVGAQYGDNGSGPNLVERWDGHRWTRLALGRPADSFNAVACATVSYCMVVGSNERDQPLAELYDHGRWRSHVVHQGDIELDAVACPRVGECVVAGSSAWTSSSTSLLSWELARGEWRWLPVVLNPKALDDVAAISCISPERCEMAGTYTFGGPGGAGYIERLRDGTWVPDESQAEARGGFGNLSCLRTGLCVATEDKPGPNEPDGGLSGIVTQAREGGRWVTLGRGLPGDDQLVVVQAGAQCFAGNWCVVTGASDTGMFVGSVVDDELRPLQVVRGVHLDGVEPWLETLACAGPSFCVQTSQNQGSPFVLVGSVASLAP